MNAVVVRHIALSSQTVAPFQKQVEQKQKQNNHWPLKDCMDLMSDISPHRAMVEVSGRKHILKKMLGVNAKGFLRMQTEGGTVLALSKSATVEVIRIPALIEIAQCDSDTETGINAEGF